ncbi:helix-turn-helix domain-containing protein [Rossellomorea sp. BNER]|uniref:helix-turn-helix domain-containing protein n=1 Tax=Rossellomorea sp. BNER TaxID=2962031 RepID=UPI003AF287B0|nr:helix-turn-helix transcriptional regulator [Rossellomorea sp. BNER]
MKKRSINSYRKSLSYEELERRRWFGQSLRERRKKKGLSLKTVAERANISEYALADIENGRVSADLQVIHKKIMRAIDQESMVIL